MRALFVSGYKEVLDRGASRAAAGLSSFLIGRGWDVWNASPKVIPNAPWVATWKGEKPDLLVWSGPTFNQGIVETIGAARTILWKHGDESLQDYPIEAIATNRAYLCVPSLWAGKKLGWDLPFRVLYPAFEPPPKVLPPVGTKWLHVGAYEPGKGTHDALETVRKNPNESFLFRSRKTGSGKLNGFPNLSWAPYTPSQEDLWADVKGLLLTSLYETFSILAYEAFSRGLPVWVSPGTCWYASCVRDMLRTWSTVPPHGIGYRDMLRTWSTVPPHGIGYPGGALDRQYAHEQMQKLHAIAESQLTAILEGRLDAP